MNLREAVLQAMDKHVTNDEREKHVVAAIKADPFKRPLLWKMVESSLKHKLEKSTGHRLPKNFDWLTVVEWLVTHMPVILQLLILVFSL